MAGTIVDFLVGKLKEPAFQEITFQLGIKTEIVKITTRLANLKGYVEDSCKGKQDTNRTEIWANQLRETSLELEDLVDEFMVDMELLELNAPPCNLCEMKSVISTVLSFSKKVKMQYYFHQQLKAKDEKLLVLEDDKSKYKIELKTNEGSNELLIGGGSGYMEGIEAVGIDMEVERIAELIAKRSDHQVKVITIWGAGGSGKTTLAKQVYERVKNDCCSWVDVNHSSDIVYVLRETIKGLYKSVGTNPPAELEKANENSLQQHILDYLVGKRYVVFFDDVWDRNLLSQIKIPSNRGSSIIITSRDKDIGVGSFMGAAPHYVEVKPLEFDLASNLFCKLAFPNNGEGWPNDTIKGLGEALVEKCSGLPVAILAMARLMSTKGSDDLREWRDALKNLESEYEGGSLASVNRAVLLSYNELPAHLKSCFLYCAMFPKTHEISVEELIRLCIAEGFINEEGHGGRTLEDIGRNYFLQLKYRSLLQFGDEYESIKMHDLYRDVACEVTRKEMFVEILEQNTKLDWKQRRLLIPDNKVKLDNNYQNMKKLRTLFICEQISFSNSFPQMLKTMKLLRVLVLKWILDDMEELPNEIGDLIHLRYISLDCHNFKHLPHSFGKLHNLQTLDLRATLVMSLPKIVSELKQLRHIIGSDDLEVADTVFTFSQLQTLCGIRITTINQARELSNATQLTELDIRFKGEESWRAICACIQKMTKLQSLSITLMRFNGTAWEFGNYFSPPLHLENLTLVDFGKLPKLFATTLNYLRSIELIECDVDEDFFNSLGKLQSLTLVNIKFTGEKLLCSEGSFPKLNKLRIECSKVTKWEIGKGAMKCLQYLLMLECGCLEMLPEGLRQLEFLKQLHIRGASQELVDRTSVGGVDRWKVEHIQRISVNKILL